MTNTDPSFNKLENALFEAGRIVEFPRVPSVASQVRTQLTTQRSRTVPRFAMALAIVFALALSLFPEARNSFLQMFGLGNLSASPLTTPTLSMTAQPNPSISITLTTSPTMQTPTFQPTRAGTPSTLSNPVDIRILAKPVAHPIEFAQTK